MSDSVKSTPEIRFKGFADAWVQRKLGEVAEKIRSYPLSRDVETGNKVTGWRYIHYGDIHKQRADVIISDEQLLSIKAGEYDTLNCGDLVLADASEDYTGIAEPCVILHDPTEKIVAGLHTIPIRPIDTNSLYLYYLLHTEGFKKFGGYVGTGLKVFGITFNNLAKFETVFPSLPEQTAIGNFFRTLDNVIALGQRKLDVLRELKRGYLQRMFPQAGERVPRVRFKGFNGEWEEKRLGEITERVTRKNTNLESSLPLTISAQFGLIDQNEFFDKQIASKDISGYYLLKKGEFAYNKSYSNGYPWGAVKRLDKYAMGVLSTLYIVFVPTDVESEFLIQYYETDSWHKGVATYAAEGARNHGLLNITPSDFFNTELLIPTIREEQIAIGDFFRNLDEQIVAQSHKMEQLKQLKVVYLQKMLI